MKWRACTQLLNPIKMWTVYQNANNILHQYSLWGVHGAFYIIAVRNSCKKVSTVATCEVVQFSTFWPSHILRIYPHMLPTRSWVIKSILAEPFIGFIYLNLLEHVTYRPNCHFLFQPQNSIQRFNNYVDSAGSFCATETLLQAKCYVVILLKCL